MVFKKLAALGKKISGHISRAIGLGKKATGRVASISNKVLSASQMARPLLPSQYQKVLDKGVALTNKAVGINQRVSAGLSKADSLNKRAQNTTSVGGGIALAKEAFHDSKNAIKSTRKMLERSKKGASAQPTPISTRMAQRALTN